MENLHGYTDSKGVPAARKAVLDYATKELGINVDPTDLNRVYIGNGVSELIMITARALCEEGYEILVPSPDYPLWTAAVNLAGGEAVHYHCDPENGWQPDIADIRAKINDKTRAIVIINPNNPTGTVYTKELLQQIVDLAREKELMILSDEIYERIIYDGAKHTSIASLADDVLMITFNGASKANRLCGYRLGWMTLSGPFAEAPAFISALDKLTSMRLCSVAPFQHLIPNCLEDDSIDELVSENGRLNLQRKLVMQRINQIPGLSMNPVSGALYGFVKIDLDKLDFKDDLDFAHKLLEEEQVLIVHSQGFNWPGKDHFRIVFLPNLEDLGAALDGIERLCRKYSK